MFVGSGRVLVCSSLAAFLTVAKLGTQAAASGLGSAGKMQTRPVFGLVKTRVLAGEAPPQPTRAPHYQPSMHPVWELDHGNGTAPRLDNGAMAS